MDQDALNLQWRFASRFVAESAAVYFVQYRVPEEADLYPRSYNLRPLMVDR